MNNATARVMAMPLILPVAGLFRWSARPGVTVASAGDEATVTRRVLSVGGPGRLKPGEHAVQGGDACSGRADLKRDFAGGPAHRPGRPWAALVFRHGEGVQLVLDAGLGLEAQAKTVSSLGAFGHGPGGELF